MWWIANERSTQMTQREHRRLPPGRGWESGVRISSGAPFCAVKASPAHAPSGRASHFHAGSPWLSPKNIENNPMQSSRAVAGTDALSRYLTRRANQQHCFIICKIRQSGCRRATDAVRCDVRRNSLIGVAGASTHDIRNFQRIVHGAERSVPALL